MSEQNIHNEPDLAALQRKKKGAFARLVDAHSDKIYRLALKMLGDQQDAEDVLQETFIKAFNHIDSFEGRSKLSTWLYRIAVNESLMLLRKRKGKLTSIEISESALKVRLMRARLALREELSQYFSEMMPDKVL